MSVGAPHDSGRGFPALRRRWARSWNWNVRERKQCWVRQSHPLSCGAAALASLLNHEDGLRDFVPGHPGESELLQRIGHSQEATLADLMRVCETFGLQTGAYELGFEDLKAIDRPAIVYWRPSVQRMKIGHYVVFRGWGEGYVLIVDPARGNRYLQEARFLRRFVDAAGVGRVLFVAAPDQDWLPLNTGAKGGSGASEVESSAWHRYF